uniref:Uncharacterized protein n=1 Tax=Brassica campestris TaxID=3711 RepID=A0A3P5ZV03_BRACM|nr:unnamed protein product [Brassica rapa]
MPSLSASRSCSKALASLNSEVRIPPRLSAPFRVMFSRGG